MSVLKTNRQRVLALLLTLFMVLAIVPAASNFLEAPQAKANATVTPVPIHNDIPRFSGVTVTAGGQNLDVANVTVAAQRSFPSGDHRGSAVAMFDMTEGQVQISVTFSGGTNASFNVRPYRANLSPTRNGNTITFTIYRWGQYVVEPTGDPMDRCVQIFANPPFQAEGTQLTGWRGNYTVPANTTVSLMPGAVIHGKVTMNNGSRLIGRGIIWGQGLAWGEMAVQGWSRSNVTVDGVAMLQRWSWVIEFRASHQITINNVKIISYGDNGDGISIQSSTGVTVTNSYVRSFDDCLVVKNYTRTNSNNHLYKNNILWADLAQPIEIGYETNAGNEGHFHSNQYSCSGYDCPAEIYNITFEDIDVIHAMHQSVLSIHNQNIAHVRDITFKDIIVENASNSASQFRYLIDFRNTGLPHNFQGHSPPNGNSDRCDEHGNQKRISNVTVNGVWVLGPGTSNTGYITSGSVTDVRITDVFYVPTQANLCNSTGAYRPPPRENVDPNWTPPPPTPTPLPPTPEPTPMPAPNPREFQPSGNSHIIVPDNTFRHDGGLTDVDTPNTNTIIWSRFNIGRTSSTRRMETFSSSNTQGQAGYMRLRNMDASWSGDAEPFAAISNRGGMNPNISANNWRYLAVTLRGSNPGLFGVAFGGRAAGKSDQRLVFLDGRSNSWTGSSNEWSGSTTALHGAVDANTGIHVRAPSVNSSPDNNAAWHTVFIDLGNANNGNGQVNTATESSDKTQLMFRSRNEAGWLDVKQVWLTNTLPNDYLGTLPMATPQGPTPTPQTSDCIDYSIPHVIVPSSGTPRINLTTGTIEFNGFTPTHFSIKGGKWKDVKTTFTDTKKFVKLFNKDLNLQLRNAAQEVVTFPLIKKAPTAPKLQVNYMIGQDISGATPGQWVLVSKSAPAVSVKTDVQIAVADASGKSPGQWGAFFGASGTTNGIKVTPLPEVNKPKVTKDVFFYRAAPSDQGGYTAAGKQKKISVKGQQKRVNYKPKNSLVKVKKNTWISINGGTPVLYSEKSGITLPATGYADFWMGVPLNGKKAAGAKQRLP